MDFVHGRGNGKNRLGPASLGSQPGKKQQGAALQPAGAHFLFLLGRNGHDGSANASPDPLLLAPDPVSGLTAYQTGHNLGSYIPFKAPPKAPYFAP